MNTWLLCAAGLSVLIALAHSVLGIVASLAGMTEHVDIPAAYKAR